MAEIDIEITPEMINAGRHELWESGLLPLGAEGGSDEIILVKEIFLAMLRAAPKS